MEKNELFQRFQQYGNGNTGDTAERVVTLPGAIGEGYRREIPLAPGLKLYLENYTLRERMTARVVPEFFPVGISFCISGRVNWTPDKPGPSPTYLTRAGNCDLSLAASNTDDGFIDCQPHEPILLISLLMGPSHMTAYDPGQKILDILSNQLEPKMPAFAHFKNRLSPSMAMAARQMMNCSLKGPAAQFYLTGKAFELAGLALDQFSSSFAAPSALPLHPVLPGPREKEQLHKVRKILDQHYTDPPSLERLARHTGLNQTKLKKGFKRLFNTTVSAYVLDRRMEKGRQLLEQGDLSVSDVAYKLGYADRTHFSRAFTKKFKCPPVTLLAQARQNNAL